MAHLSLLIKPASSLCNLNCTYCFYHDVADNREVNSYGIMEDITRLTVIEKAKDYVGNDTVTFAFQGGEPTLAGLEYFKSFVDEVSEHFKASQVHYAIQTNGIVIDEQWAQFFKKHNFLVGLSLDGKKDTHNLNRLDHKGNDSYKQVIKAVDIMNEYQVQFNILTVLNKPVSRKIISIYNDYKTKGFRYLQFIPCLNPFGDAFALKPKEYEKTLKTLFDLWYEDIMSETPISIRMFDNILSMILGQPPESCDMNGRCSVQNVIEADGSVYPCDFYVLDEYKLGSVHEHSFNDMISSPVSEVFIEPSLAVPDECKTCRYYGLCRNGCRRYREDNKYYYCEAMKEFYDYSIEKFEKLARVIRRK